MAQEKAHFIGIAGAGMSAVAKLLMDAGIAVTGSDDEAYPPVTDFLASEGIAYARSYSPRNLPADVDYFVIGKNAKLVPQTNDEVAAAFETGKPIYSFPEVLARVSNGKVPIVVAGSHGKSTSAALLAHCLEKLSADAAGRSDPSFFIGAIPITPSTSARMGAGKFFVIEGDEYPSSNTDARSKFLHYSPQHILCTPLAHDHVNVFPTPDDYLRPFVELARALPRDGALVVCSEGPLSQEFLNRIDRPVITYGLEDGEFQAERLVIGERSRFTLTHRGAALVDIETEQLGTHNIQNMVGVSALLLSRGIATPAEIAAVIPSFRGVTRRLDRKSETTTIPIFEGFGSSHEKAKSAIGAMRLHFPKRRLIVVFEPYTFSWRNRNAISWYDDVFDGADKVLVFRPTEMGSGTHAQLSHDEIVARVQAAGIDVEIIGEAGKAEAMFETMLRPDDAVLLLTSGNLGGLIKTIPKIAEQKFPK
jgi:UDP-N-acetylmuramate: L-alanyl-gamma-D-glutamyl-meso-diaminopimelate ligase